MNQNPSVTVHIMDKEYCIACPETEREKLESSARHLDTRMREIRSIGKVIGAERVAVMAALNITYELLHGAQDANSRKTREQIRRTLERAEAALSDEGHNNSSV